MGALPKVVFGISVSVPTDASVAITCSDVIACLYSVHYFSCINQSLDGWFLEK